MKFRLLFLFCLLSFSSHAQAHPAYQQADQELNRAYQQVVKEYHAQPAFLAKLKVAQQRWLQFRDAELQARYPDANPQVAYGSSYAECRAHELTALTKARTQQLRLWLTGVLEGDVCTGSVRMVPGR